MRRKIILLFVCIAIIIEAIVVTKYYNKDDNYNPSKIHGSIYWKIIPKADA